MPADLAPDARVAGALALARTTWPALAVPDERMLPVLERALAEGTPLDELCVADLYLATACADGDPAGAVALDALIEQTVSPALRSMSFRADAIADLLQDVRARVLVATGDDPPRIASYSGRAPLRSWLRTIATRTALDRMRRDEPAAQGGADQLIAAVATADTPELELFRRQYLSAFKQAFESAVASLEVRDRNCLRHHFVDGLTLDEIGALYGVHKSTVSRWLDAARELVTKRTRVHFQQHVKVSAAEMDDVIRLLRSQIDLSLTRNLGS